MPGAIPCKAYLCYTVIMNVDIQSWDEWKILLDRWGLRKWFIVALEFAGPFSVVGAQLLFLGSPLLCEIIPQRQLDVLSGILEEPVHKQAFTRFLRES